MSDPIDILGFDSVADCEAGFDFELKGQDGSTPTGVIVTVIGSHADAVVKWATKTANAAMREQVMASRRGKPVEVRQIEDLREQNLDGAAVRVVGWKNVAQDFDRELLKQALRRNPHWIEQIVRESDDLGNFTGKRSTK